MSIVLDTFFTKLQYTLRLMNTRVEREEHRRRWFRKRPQVVREMRMISLTDQVLVRHEFDVIATIWPFCRKNEMVESFTFPEKVEQSEVVAFLSTFLQGRAHVRLDNVPGLLSEIKFSNTTDAVFCKLGAPWSNRPPEIEP